MGFQASKDDFDASTYVKVNERLREFWTRFPEGFISTFRAEAKDGITFKTVLCRNDKDARLFAESGISAATGHAYLSNSMKGEKVEEYCETVSLGRALAILGFRVEKSIASNEEMQQFERQKESKKTAKECCGDCDCDHDVVIIPKEESIVIATSNVTTSTEVVAGDPTITKAVVPVTPTDEPKMKLAQPFQPRSRFKRS